VQISFAKDVMPIFRESCLSCHDTGGQGTAASGFSVASYQSIMKGTKFGPVIKPGFSFSSTLQLLIEHKADDSINMPKGMPILPPKHIETIGRWIDQGAKNN
jgi:hypothetical protein